MKNYIIKNSLVFALLFVFYIGNAQTSAVTETGKKVILSSNGKWKYVTDSLEKDIVALDSIMEEDTIYHNPTPYYTNIENYSDSKLVSGSILKTGVNIDTYYWRIKKCSKNEAGEYIFINKFDGSSAVFMNENIKNVSALHASELYLSGLRYHYPNAEIVHSEFRKVNGLQVLYLDIVTEKKKTIYEAFVYIYVSSEGICELVVLNEQKKVNKKREFYENFLNGLVALN